MEKHRKTANIKEDSNDSDSWGYVVCFGTIVTFVAAIGHVNSFGLIYNEFIEDTHATSKSLTTAHGVFSVMLALGGILLNIQKQIFTLRTGGLIGAALFTLGSFATIPITNTNQLPITFGMLQGMGFGMMVPVCYATLNYYFVKKRTTVMSICKAIQGVIQIFYPQFIEQMMSLYGFRGTLLLISGISLHTVAGMIMMRTWEPTKKAANLNDDHVTHEIQDLLDVEENVENNQGNKVNGEKRNDKTRWKIVEILNVKVLLDPVYSNICIGQSFVNFSDLTFFILQPMLLFQFGFDQSQVAYCISIGASADVLGRCALALISSLAPVNTRLLFYVATFFTLLMRIVLLQVRQFVWVAVTTGALGLLRALIHVASPLVIASYVTHDDFPGAYAMYMVAAGIVNVAFAPLIGLLKDLCQDYVPAFYALTLCCVPCLLFWPVEYFLNNK